MSEEERRALRDYIPCPQWRAVVNLLLELSVGDLGRRGNWIGERFKCDARRLVERTASLTALFISTSHCRIWDFSPMRLAAAMQQGYRRNRRMIDWKTMSTFDDI